MKPARVRVNEPIMIQLLGGMQPSSCTSRSVCVTTTLLELSCAATHTNCQNHLWRRAPLDHYGCSLANRMQQPHPTTTACVTNPTAPNPRTHRAIQLHARSHQLPAWMHHPRPPSTPPLALLIALPPSWRSGCSGGVSPGSPLTHPPGRHRWAPPPGPDPVLRCA